MDQKIRERGWCLSPEMLSESEKKTQEAPVTGICCFVIGEKKEMDSMKREQTQRSGSDLTLPQVAIISDSRCIVVY